MTDAPALLRLAREAARAAAVEIARRSGHVTGVGAKSSATDPVTDTDRAADAAVRAVLDAERPADGLFSEEGDERPSRSGFRWVVDPLDGTVNHVYGVPHSAVSIACERLEDDGWMPVAAVVVDVARGETFTATLGGGAYLGDVPLTVRDPVALEMALVATEFSYHAASRSRQVATLADVLPRVRDIRSTGSSALDLCWTAAGRCDAFYEDELPRWDWAAGALVVREAGGLLDPLRDGVRAAGPALHAALAPLLA